jgi:hypothetical protein
MFRGSWQQAVINYDTASAVMQASTAWLYVSGMVFASLAALVIAHELWLLATGRLDDAQLVGVVESDDVPHAAVTIAIFLGALLGAMALGVPIAFALLFCGAALMWHLNMFDAQILAQNTIEGANSFPLLAVPFFMLAGEIMNAGGLSPAHRQLRDDAGRPCEGRARLRRHHRRGHHGGALGLGGRGCGRAGGPAAADDEPRRAMTRPAPAGSWRRRGSSPRSSRPASDS